MYICTLQELADTKGEPSSFKSVDVISQEEFQKMRQEEKRREVVDTTEAQPPPPPPPKPILVESHLNPDAKPFFVPSTTR